MDCHIVAGVYKSNGIKLEWGVAGLYHLVYNLKADINLTALFSGVNPNQITTNGKTCLGEACNIGNLSIVKLLLDGCKALDIAPKISFRIKKNKTHKRKLRNFGYQHDETVIKYKNRSDRYSKSTEIKENYHSYDETKIGNQGYFVFVHGESSSSDESKLNSSITPTSPSSVISTPSDLEWDENIGKFAPTTSEDETWTSMYK